MYLAAAYWVALCN